MYFCVLANCIGWIRTGNEKHADGCAVVLCNGDEGVKRMEAGKVSPAVWGLQRECSLNVCLACSNTLEKSGLISSVGILARLRLARVSR